MNFTTIHISYVTTVLCAVMGLYLQDPTWILAAVIGLIALYLPYHYTKDFKKTYCKKILYPLPVFEIAFIILALLLGHNMAMFEEYWWISMALQALVLMTSGYGIMIILNNHTDNKISKRWMLIYSMLFACTVAAFCSYIVILFMMMAGYPISVETGHTPIIYNWYLMTQMTVALFVTIGYAVILKYSLANVPIKSLLAYTGVDSNE